ncbi:hypothetical protein [Streptomyces flaveus]|uniref:Uncharacterized protein n=1 Tax=Streptomyces flaveus TaxID=66370 RepID=A0A917RD17_9ACTN|nr:hypothetical protein [Streptomyces flaveus]GGL02436.1 hypothetical protein GCM10010094_74130 [Streptomyces flaveus]
MRAVHLASAALLGVGALTLATPAAFAVDGGDRGNSFGFDVSPTTAAAGDRVTLSVWGCETEVEVSSGVFDPVVIPKGEHSAEAVVGWAAEPGAGEPVTFQCGEEYGHKDLTIEAGQQPGQSHMYAHKGVNAGVGGTFADFDLGDIGLGLALVAGSVGAAYHWSNRRTADEHN